MKERFYKILIYGLAMLCCLFSFDNLRASGTAFPAKIDLKGEWQFCLAGQDEGQTVPVGKEWESFQLPGTTDTNQKGMKNTNAGETTHLTRLYSYVGKAWYKKDVFIPKNWKGKCITLFLERTKPTHIFIDGSLAGSSDDISTAQTFDISRFLTAGRKHEIAILVDNGKSVPPQLLDNSHAYTESTQTNWNGIIGELYLSAKEQLHLSSVRLEPDVAGKLVRVHITVASPGKITRSTRLSMTAQAFNVENRGSFPKEQTFSLEKSRADYTFDYVLGDNALLWSEFSPALYRLNIRLGDKDEQTLVFGLRDFTTKGTHFAINGATTFLRGKHDACVFPLTAHTAMDVPTWRHYFQVAKAYGINHYRFHSWCPPEACFEAADIEGVYLQPELPFWGTIEKKDERLVQFLKKEGLNILRTYGDHASFVMFSLGNELFGDKETMVALMNTFKQADSRRLYAIGSNSFLGYQGHTPGEDYLTTCRVGGEAYGSFDTHVRGTFSFADAYDGGYINHMEPNSVMNFSKALTKCPVPVISHETGQFQVYPDYKEIKKYTGVLYPYNMEVFRKHLEKAGMSDQADAFFKASGKWAAELYKADIEMDLRTKELAGFQLLDLQDYPGQGSAYVGMLDAFMDSKGLIAPEAWRQFCNRVVPLLEVEKFCWTNSEQLKGSVKVADYGNSSLNGKTLKWLLQKEDGEKVAENAMVIHADEKGLVNVGEITASLSSLSKATRLDLLLSIEGTEYRNTYPLWVYPSDEPTTVPKGITVVRGELDARLLSALEQEAEVLWFPKKEDYKEQTVGGLFTTDYWNYRMFRTICENAKKPVSPGTMGLLIPSRHPLFASFPTEEHTNWQWFSIVKQSYPFILSNFPTGYRPIVQVIDNIERNHKLGLVFELGVGKGKLLVCMADLEAVKDKPEVRSFYRSLLDYMKSDAFKPTLKVSKEKLVQLFHSSVENGKIETLKNISYQ